MPLVRRADLRCGPPIEIPLPEKMIGKLIGVRGATIGQIRGESGARVDIDTRERIVRISGTNDQKKEAERLILGILKEKELTSTRELKPYYLEVLSCELAQRFLSEEIYTILETDPQSFTVKILYDRKVVSIEGEDQKLKDRALEVIMAQLNTWVADTVRRVPIPVGADARWVVEDEFIRYYSETHNVQITAYQDDEETGMTFKGPECYVNTLAEVAEEILGSNIITECVPLPIGWIEMCDTQLLRDLRNDIHIHVVGDSRMDTSIELDGIFFKVPASSSIEETYAAVQYKRRVLEEILIYYFPKNCGLFFIQPEAAVGSIIGRGGYHLEQCRNRREPAVLRYNQNNHSIWIGTSSKLELDRIMDKFCENLNQWHNEHLVVALAQGSVGSFIGRGGSNIRRIQEECGVVLNYNDNYVVISGDDPKNMEKARYIILESTKRFRV